MTRIVVEWAAWWVSWLLRLTPDDRTCDELLFLSGMCIGNFLGNFSVERMSNEWSTSSISACCVSMTWQAEFALAYGGFGERRLV